VRRAALRTDQELVKPIHVNWLTNHVAVPHENQPFDLFFKMVEALTNNGGIIAW
jgi:hypothetical protein